MTTTGRMIRGLVTCLALGVLAPVPAGAQLSSVVHGRLEDAVTTRPIAGALVRSADGRTAVESDSLGAFVIALAAGEPLVLEVEMFGYRTETFELDEGATERISVLRLEPEAVELEGLHVLAESALEEMLGDLQARRGHYQGGVTAMDRRRLEHFGDRTVWDVVRAHVPALTPCGELSGLCVPRRTRVASATGFVPVKVCIDNRPSWSAEDDLSVLTARDVSVIEIFGWGRGGINIYTPRYLVHAARDGRKITGALASLC